MDEVRRNEPVPCIPDPVDRNRWPTAASLGYHNTERTVKRISSQPSKLGVGHETDLRHTDNGSERNKGPNRRRLGLRRIHEE